MLRLQLLTKSSGSSAPSGDPVRYMAPPIAHAPPKACSNFPLCSKYCCRSSHDGKTKFCKPCLNGARCRHPDCTNFAMPDTITKKKKWLFQALCASHVNDPCYQDQSPLEWNLCRNSMHGCQLLSWSVGATCCYACSNGALPCKHALAGCTNLVRHDPKNSDHFLNISRIPSTLLLHGHIDIISRVTKSPAEHMPF